MATFTEEEFLRQVADDLMAGIAKTHTDAHGQIVVLTGLYRWSDGTIRDEKEKE